MSLPPSSHASVAPFRRRIREAFGLLAVAFLSLALVSTIAPESWRLKLTAKVATLLRGPRLVERQDNTGTFTPGVIGHAGEIVDLPTRQTSDETKVTPKGPKQSVIKDTWVLPALFDIGRPIGETDVKILQLQANVIRSPKYEIVGGESKDWVPQPWIQLTVTFSSRRHFDRLAVLYEIDDAWGYFAEAIAYEDVAAGESHVATAYLIPAQARHMVKGMEAPLRAARAALFHGGSVLTASEFGRPARMDTDREYGFLRPRSLTPFAPLAWDAFLPDAGFAARSDFEAVASRPALTKTSNGRSSPQR